MNKNEIYNITIEDIGNDGEGIGHVIDRQSGRSMAIFVKDTVVGDVASIKIIKCKKNYAYGRLDKLITPSKFRVEAVCSNAGRCGGCALMHMSYDKQLEYKWNKVKNCIERIGGMTDVEKIMEPIYGMKEPYQYRNKMQFPVGIDKAGEIEIGFYAGRTHSIINLDTCHIGHPINDYILKNVRQWLQSWQNKTGSFIYNEELHKGLVRHILTRVGFATGELMVCIIINGDSLVGNVASSQEQDAACTEELLKCLNNAVDEYNAQLKIEDTNDQSSVITLTNVSLNINRERTNKILGDKRITLWGKDYISDYIGDIRFNISPMSFYQVNPSQTKVLYDKAVEYAQLSGDETVWDMYCGIGTISLCLAKKAKQVYGVEIVPQAIEDAKENAKLNDLSNTKFFCGKAEVVVPSFYNGELTDNAENEGGRNPDVVVVDPPRKGCDTVLLDTISRMSPKRLVYVSCDPATLARDLKYLTEKGFKPVKICVVDQFGHSTHVEVVTLLTRNEVPQ